MNVMLSAPGLYFLSFIHIVRISLMKIVSQNTTALSSATAPGNNQPQLV
ncbi:antirestriction protein, partial [Salmonella enterica subsp. enterica serovar Kentucky]|nr:antirestriction protein [Salmonella enterica subsp. enterica serovar Kentucky]